MAARTQVSLTFIKMFALILIIIPGIMALANGKNHMLLYQYIIQTLECFQKKSIHFTCINFHFQMKKMFSNFQ